MLSRDTGRDLAQTIPGVTGKNEVPLGGLSGAWGETICLMCLSPLVPAGGLTREACRYEYM